MHKNKLRMSVCQLFYKTLMSLKKSSSSVSCIFYLDHWR